MRRSGACRGGRIIGPHGLLDRAIRFAPAAPPQALVWLPFRGQDRHATQPGSGARMPNYLSPGVYVEEVSSGSKPIEGVGTAVAAFVGFAEKGPLNAPTLVTNWTQFTGNFGSFLPG